MGLYKVILSIILIATFHIGFSKPHFKINSHKVKKAGHEFTISKINLDDGYEVTKSVKVGIGKSIDVSYSDSGNLMAIFLPQKSKKDKDIVALYDTKSLTEISRFKVKDFVSKVFNLKLIKSIPYFILDESMVIIAIKKKGKETLLNSYDVKTGQLNYSVALPKKMDIIEQIPHTNRIITGISTSSGNYLSLQIFDMKTGKVIADYSSRKARKKYFVDGENIVIIKKGREANDKHFIDLVDLISGKQIFTKKLSLIAPALSQKHQSGDHLYVASSIHEEEGLTLFEIIDNSLVKLMHTKETIKPKMVVYDKTKQNFFIVGRSNSVFMETSKIDQSGYLNNPFDVATGFFSDDASLVYLREGKGSEVGIFDFNSKTMIKESGTGRAGVKFGQFMASALLASAGAYYTGYFNVSFRFSDTAMHLDRHGKSLYVINTKTSDVTIFNAKTLEGRTGIATGKGTFGVFSLEKEYFPEQRDGDVFVISYQKINYFDSLTNEVKKVIEYDAFVTLDFEDNIFFSTDKEDNLNLYRLSTGELLNTYENESSFNSIVFKIAN